MRTSTRDKLGVGLLGVMVAMFIAMIVIWVSEPPRGAPKLAVTPGVSAVEGAFCTTLAAVPDLEPRFGTALSQSGELQHQTLGALAGRWGQDGSSAAREQVLLECRRLGLTP